MGEGVNEDINLAKSWYEKAAAQGHDFANYILGRFYGDGVFGYTDLPKAVQYLSKAAENNYDGALYQLGLIYENGGQGVQRNFRLAGEYFKRAADLGHEEAKEKYKAYQ
jgi:TPR repeat protein